MAGMQVTNDTAILAVLTGVCAFFFWLERATRWRLFQYLPPLVFIYLAPVILANTGVLPTEAPVYGAIKRFALPMMLVLMLLNVDVGRAIRLVGRGVGVMLCGTLGVVVGAVTGAWLMQRWLSPDTWKAFGALAGSWVGGTGNMAAVAQAVDADGTALALAIMADTTILLLWLPVLLSSKKIADRFARFARVDAERVAEMDAAMALDVRPARPATYQQFLYLFFAALAVTAFAELATGAISAALEANDREWPVAFSAGTCQILLVTTLGIGLSFSPLGHAPASRELGMALVFLFMAMTGATANLAEAAAQAPAFWAAALVCIVIHGAFCLIGAKLLYVDVHTAAIASAANIGGIATATVVAAHHKESMMPAAVLLALVGYAIGNYAGWLAAALCRLVL